MNYGFRIVILRTLSISLYSDNGNITNKIHIRN